MAPALTTTGSADTSITGPTPAAGRPSTPEPPRGGIVRTTLRRWVHPTAQDALLLGLVAAAILAVEQAAHSGTIPPGPDSGHWITTSYSFIGRAHPTDFRVQPWLYPPALFPLIGAVVLATGSALTTGFVVIALLLALYGLTTIHLARRYLRSGPAQLLFVALAVLNGTTLQMLFWAGYPNFLALSEVNEAFVFLLAFVRTREEWAGIAFFAFAALTYLTHSLTFVVLAGAALLGLLLLLADDPTLLRLVRNRGTWIGAGIFLVAAGGYEGLSLLLHIQHAGYLFTNPATYVIDPLGLLFRPFGFAPAFFPVGTRFYLPSGEMAALLLAVGAAAVLVPIALARRWPGRIPRRLLLAIGWCAAVLLVPAIGYLVHVDTDYPRFAYFLPLPVALAASQLLEIGIGHWRSGEPASREAPPPRPRPRRDPTVTAAWIAAGVAVVALFGTVTLPTVTSAESQYATPVQDNGFLTAIGYLNHGAPPGAVLSEDAEYERWVEALTTRNSFAFSPSWLQFYPEEIADEEYSYWALNSAYVVADGGAGLGFSGPNLTTFDAFPQYVPYLEGVPFPAVRLALTSLTVSYRSPNGSAVTLPEPDWPAPSTGLAATASVASTVFETPDFSLNETASLVGDGNAEINLSLSARGGASLTGLSLTLKAPVNDRLGDVPQFSGFQYAGGSSFSLTLTGPDGALPTLSSLPVSGTLTEPPVAATSFVSPPVNRSYLTLNFPASGSAYEVGIDLSAPGLSNPAIRLPDTFTTDGFLSAHQIRYAMFQTAPGYQPTVSLFERDLGFSSVYNSDGWQILAEAGS